MEFTKVKNVQWGDENHTVLMMDVLFPELSDEYVPFATRDGEPDKHCVDLYDGAIAGKFGEIAEYAIEEKPVAVLEEEERTWRNSILDKVFPKIDQYEKDQPRPKEFRTSKLTTKKYTDLLKLQKLLCDYPESKDFPCGKRPTVPKWL